MNHIITLLARLLGLRKSEKSNVLMAAPAHVEVRGVTAPPLALEDTVHVTDIADRAGVHIITVLNLLDDLDMSISRTGRVEPMLARSLTALLLDRVAQAQTRNERARKQLAS